VDGVHWEFTGTLRALPGDGPARVDFVTPDDRVVGTWHFVKRQRIPAPVSLEGSHAELSVEELAAGEGTVAILEVSPRNAFGERLGPDVEVGVEAPPFLRVGAPVLTERSTFEIPIEAGHFGGVYPIQVTLDGALLDTLTLTVSGPAPPETSFRASWDARAPMDRPPVESPAPAPTPSSGCGQGESADPWAFILLCFLVLRWICARDTDSYRAS